MRLCEDQTVGWLIAFSDAAWRQKCSERSERLRHWPVRPVASTSYMAVVSAALTLSCFFGTGGGEVQESCALTRTCCPFQAPRFSCFLLEVLGQACFLSRSDCPEGSIIFASRFTFKKQNVTVCVCVRFHFFECCPECYGSVLKYMRWYRDCSIFHRSRH